MGVAGAGSSRDGGGGRSRGGGGARRPSRGAGRRTSGGTPSGNDSNGSAGGVLRETIPSDYGAGRDLQERILRDVQRHGFTTDNAFAIRIALEEALVNAIKHGNRLDRGKKIHVEARVTKERAEITIEDEGPGFNRSDIPDPTLE